LCLFAAFSSGWTGVFLPGSVEVVMRVDSTTLLFCFNSVMLPVFYWHALCEPRTRAWWQSRNNHVMIKPFRPDTSEAAYLRFRFWSRAALIPFTLAWLVMVRMLAFGH
jgi:hypothetical protein